MPLMKPVPLLFKSPAMNAPASDPPLIRMYDGMYPLTALIEVEILRHTQSENGIPRRSPEPFPRTASQKLMEIALNLIQSGEIGIDPPVLGFYILELDIVNWASM